MSWTQEIAGAFGDLLAAVGQEVQWTDQHGELHINTDCDGFPKALFKRPGEIVLSSMQISDEHAIEFRAFDFPGIVHGDTVGILGMRFRVREVLDGDDPVLKTARLTRLDG